MIYLLSAILFALMILASTQKNPLKLSIVMMIISGVFMTHLSMSKGYSWMSSVYFLLFMGGVLILFMILSSLTPNSVESQKKYITTSLIWIFLSSLSAMSGFQESANSAYTSTGFSGSVTSFAPLTAVMIIYFMATMNNLDKGSQPLRSFMMCC